MDTLDTKSEFLDRKKEMSPTFCNFEIFDHDPQLDMKFWNLTSNFETHKNIGQNYDYICIGTCIHYLGTLKVIT